MEKPPQAVTSSGGIEKTDKVHSLLIMPNATALKPEAIAAYRTDIPYVFALTLTRAGEERYAELVTDSPTFVNVCTARRQQHPGWAIVESWEILPTACRTDEARAQVAQWQQQARQAIAVSEPLPGYEELFTRADEIGERYAA